jgi:hypothetical protein
MAPVVFRHRHTNKSAFAGHFALNIAFVKTLIYGESTLGDDWRLHAENPSYLSPAHLREPAGRRRNRFASANDLGLGWY